MQKEDLYYVIFSSVPYIVNRSQRTSFYTSIESWTFDQEHCFLCGEVLNSQNRTREHVFPQWLLNKYKLHNDKLTLQNHTAILYKQLTIPCCQNCNGNFLSPLEKEIQKAHDQGVEAFKALPHIRIFQWVAKIQYGILFRQLSLFRDRSDSEAHYILDRDDLNELASLHFFLQSVRLPLMFIGFHPWSIFIVKIMKTDSNSFDYRDDVLNGIICIKMGEIGVIVSLEDMGVIEYASDPLFKNIEQLELYPMQFSELGAYINYQRSLLNLRLTYFSSLPSSMDNFIEVRCILPRVPSKKPLFNYWDNEIYNQYLYEYLSRYNTDVNYMLESNTRFSCIFNQEGNLIQLDKAGKPVKFLKPIQDDSVLK